MAPRRFTRPNFRAPIEREPNSRGESERERGAAAAEMSTPDKVDAAPTGPDEASPAVEKQKQVKDDDDVFFVELPAPAGWQKKFIPKSSGTPKKNEIIFISPTGEEIRNKRQLGLFLKSHPGGPPSSEFDWGTGETLRRSSRISGKAKATEIPEGEPLKKRGRTSSSKKKSVEKKDVQGEEDGAPEEESSPTVKGMKDLDAEFNDNAPEDETFPAGTELKQSAETETKDEAPEDETSGVVKETKQSGDDMETKDEAREDETSGAVKETKQSGDDTEMKDGSLEETEEAEMNETEKTDGGNGQPTTDETVAKEDRVSMQETIPVKDVNSDGPGNAVPITGVDGGKDESAEAMIDEQKAAVEEKPEHQQIEEAVEETGEDERLEEKVEDKEENKDSVGEHPLATEVLPSLEVGMASAEENMEHKEKKNDVGEDPSTTEVSPPSVAEMTSVDNGSHEDSQDHKDVHPKDRDEMPAQPKASPIQC